MIKKLLILRENSQIRFKVPELVNQKIIGIKAKNSDFENQIQMKETLIFENGMSNWIEDTGLTRYFYKISIGDDIYLGAERKLPIKLFNCRDLGGYINQQGRMVKWGKLYRSDVLKDLDEADKNYMINLNLQSVIDFRGEDEILKSPDTSVREHQHYVFTPHAEIAKQASESTEKKSDSDKLKIKKLEEFSKTEAGKKRLIIMKNAMAQQMEDLVLSESSKEAYQLFLNILIKNDGPHLFHCQGGKDRTGWAAVLVLSLLEVDRKTIEEDYMLTREFNRVRNNQRMAIYEEFTDNKFVLDFLSSLQKTKLSYLEKSFDAIKGNYGTITNYVNKELNFSEENIEKLKLFYLEK